MDHTGLRIALAELLNDAPHDKRAEVEARYGKIWTTAELQSEFDVLGFLAPFVSVCRKSDGREGTMMFTHSPRWYFNFGWIEPEGEQR